MSEAAFRTYLSKIEQAYRIGNATEHTYRPSLQMLIEEVGSASKITATNEPKRVQCGAPDYVISQTRGQNRFTLGYVEAKDIGVSLDKEEHSDQLKRYRGNLHNLILTDYLEFRWYVNGEARATARLARPGAGGRLTIEKNGQAAVEQMLSSFLAYSPEPIRRPKDLAERLARLTRMIRDLAVASFEEGHASAALRDLHQAFKEVLIPDLSISDFADMFAQTLAYGLFAARYNHKGSALFSRDVADHEIPRTNPFLRKLFGAISGPDLDDEPFIGFVDDLAQVLAITDMGEVLANFGKSTRQEDPVVHFYETFLAAYDPKLRELRGVYYTPEPVVSYIVRSVDHLLKTQFGCPDGLADTSKVDVSHVDEQGEVQIERRPKVLLLDPACGTGTFSYMVIKQIRETYQKQGNAGMWSAYVREHLLPRLFSFELLMAPYAMAHLKLGMQLAGLDLPAGERESWAYDFKGSERLGIYLTNTLEEAAKRSQMLLGSYLSDEANEAARVKRDYPVMVVLGNPPYSGHSANKGEWITNLLRGKEMLQGQDGAYIFKRTHNYFQVDGQPLGEQNPKYLLDDYVKFIRFAQWRIEQTGYGVLAFITNHGYLNNPTFRGMRQSLMQTFDEMYILDLHGNTKRKERAPDGSKDENVFDIQQGVAIGIFVKRQDTHDASHLATIHHAQLWGERTKKYQYLAEQSIKSTQWAILKPQTPFYLFEPQHTELLPEYDAGLKMTSIMPVSSTGIKTHRDHFVLDFDARSLRKRIETFRNLSVSDEQIATAYGLEDTRDWKLPARRRSLAANQHWAGYLTECLYRPFDNRAYFHHEDVVELPRSEVMRHMLAGENLGLITNRLVNDTFEHVLCTNSIINDCTLSAESKERSYLFPLYLYPNGAKSSLWEEDTPTSAPGGRRANLSAGFIKEIAGRLGMTWVEDGKGNRRQTFGPEDVFAYLYAILHAPTYRERYAEFLKIDFPRIPLTSNPDLFRALCAAGDELVRLHLLEGQIAPITNYPVPGPDTVEAARYSDPIPGGARGRVWINSAQYFDGVPPEVWAFHIGGYQVCQKWLKDRKGRVLSHDDLAQYQRTIAALAGTIRQMEQIDEALAEHGGWPDSFRPRTAP